MVVDDGFGDGEAEAGVAVVGGAGAGLVGAVETLEDVGEVGFGDAGAVVLDGEDGVGALGLAGDGDVAAVLEGVGDEVCGQDGDGLGLGVAGGGGKAEVDGAVALLGEGLEVAGDVLEEGGEVGDGEAGGRGGGFLAGRDARNTFSGVGGRGGGPFGRLACASLAGRDARNTLVFLSCQEEEGLDEAAHALGGVATGLEGFAVFLGGAVALEDALGFGEEDGEGGAELVGGVGGELALALEGGVEALEGVVEDAGELAELAGLGDLDALLEVANGDA